MHQIPTPKSQADLLATALREHGIELPHQQALEAVARVMGHKNWKTYSAAPTHGKQPLTAVAAATAKVAEILQSSYPGPLDGNVYEALVTVDMSLSRRLRVLAHNENEAKVAIKALAFEESFRGFELDESYRGPRDYYFGDEDEIKCLSDPEVSGDGDMCQTATYAIAAGDVHILVSRQEPDASNDARRSKCDVDIKLTRPDKSFSVAAAIRGWRSTGELWLDVQGAVNDGDFDEKLAIMTKRLKAMA